MFRVGVASATIFVGFGAVSAALLLQCPSGIGGVGACLANARFVGGPDSTELGSDEFGPAVVASTDIASVSLPMPLAGTGPNPVASGWILDATFSQLPSVPGGATGYDGRKPASTELTAAAAPVAPAVAPLVAAPAPVELTASGVLVASINDDAVPATQLDESFYRLPIDTVASPAPAPASEALQAVAALAATSGAPTTSLAFAPTNGAATTAAPFNPSQLQGAAPAPVTTAALTTAPAAAATTTTVLPTTPAPVPLPAPVHVADVPGSVVTPPAIARPATPSVLAAPAVDPAPATPAGERVFVRVGDMFVNARSGPASSRTKLFVLEPGQLVEATGRDKGWVRVVDDQGRAGWVYSTYLVDQNVASLPEAAPTAAPAARASAPAPVQTPAAATTTSTTPGGLGIFVIGGAGVNVRAAPSSSGEKLFALEAGQQVTATQNQRGWLRITDAQGRVGWAYSDFLVKA